MAATRLEKIQVRYGAINFGVLVVPLILYVSALTAAQRSATEWSNGGFEIRVIAPDTEQLIRDACTKTQAFDNGTYMSCYMSDWAKWVTRRRSEIIPQAEQRRFDLFLSGGGILAGPATSYAVFPDGSRRVIWSAIDKFGEGAAYFLVSPARRDVDVLWVRKGVPIKYFGPDATILRDRKIGAWLPTVPFPGNPVNPIW